MFGWIIRVCLYGNLKGILVERVMMYGVSGLRVLGCGVR